MNQTDLLSMTPAEAEQLSGVLNRLRRNKQPVVMDIHHPERSEGWPRYEHEEFPMMVYHPVQLDPRIEGDRANIKLRNQRNPGLPALDLPHQQPLTRKVENAEALAAAEKEGFVRKPPFIVGAEEIENAEAFDPLAASVADPGGKGKDKPKRR